MAFKNRQEFISAAASEKITLATVNARTRLYVWQDEGGGIWSKVVPNFVAELIEDGAKMVPGVDEVSLSDGQFYYDIVTTTLYAKFTGSVAPNTIEVIVTYKLFFSDKGLSLPHDLQNVSTDVHWSGRIVTSPGYKHKIGIDQSLRSLVGEGTLQLKNQDGGLDNIFDTYIFENQEVVIYSWNPDLQPAESRVIYRGRITNKYYDGIDVKLKIKDQIFSLLDSPSLTQYGDADNVSDSVKGQIKRRIYGRVDGLRCQSVDQIADGIQLTGTFSANAKPQKSANIEGILTTNSLSVNNNGEEFTVGDIVLVGKDADNLGYVDTIINIFYDSINDEYDLTFAVGWAGPNPNPIIGQNIERFSHLIGTGTQVLTEVRQNDKIIIGNQEAEVKRVISDTLIIVGDEFDYAFANSTAKLVPDRGSKLRNRDFVAAGHICAEVTHSITEVIQLNRVRVNSTEGLFSGDFVEFIDTGERIEIKNIAPGNIIVLQQNMINRPAVSSDVIRRPIQEVYIAGVRINPADFTINNTTDCGLSFSSDAEFNIAREKNSSFTGEFINGSRVVSFSISEISLADVFRPGDWVKPNDLTYFNYYEIVNVNDKTLELATTFTDPSTTELVEYKSVEYIEDDTIVSVNILGKTEDGTANGVWISTVAQAQRDLIEDIGINTYNSQSFIDGQEISPQLISIAIPSAFTSKTLPDVKGIIDNLSRSTNSSLTLDNDLLIKFKTLNVAAADDLIIIKDSDVIDWDIKATNGKTFRRVISNYRFVDVDNATLERGNQSYDFNSTFVERYIETNKVENLELYLYEERDAKIATHRFAYYNQLGTATLTITTDLRLENIEIGQEVIVDFERMYRRFGSDTFKKKVMLVAGKTLTGERTELILSDLGNTYNRSSFITPNSAPDWSSATDEEKLLYGYITDNQGIVNNEEKTANIHLIS